MTPAQQAGLLAEVVSFCREMKLPTVARECETQAEQVRRAGGDPLLLLHGLLVAEHDERSGRRMTRRLKEAHFPQVKTIDGFDFKRNPTLDETRIRELLTADFVSAGRPVLLLGGTGTGKTHLASAIGYQACARGHAVRFVTAAALVNELVEANDARALSRVVGRYARFDLLVLDELGYLPLSQTASQLLFQVVAERGERKATIVTTNLPFSEWTSIIPDPRLCRAFVERITFRATILETGDHSVRLEEMLKLTRTKPKKEVIANDG